jgi:hypothetical protein
MIGDDEDLKKKTKDLIDWLESGISDPSGLPRYQGYSKENGEGERTESPLATHPQ